jgi:hypothetical protein
MKLIRLKNSITVILTDGSVLTSNECTDAFYNSIVNAQNDEEIKCLMLPEFCKKEEEIKIKTEMLNDFNNSKYLSVFGNSIYMKSICELTVPEDLAIAFYKAEVEGNEELIQTYLNFWTLCSLNPDSRARTNLFWFLNRYGMTISKSGLFVAYRNVVLKSEGKEISTKLAAFISNAYTNVKFKNKKAPKNYFVVKHEGEYRLTQHPQIYKKLKGNLAELYLKLSEVDTAPVYTDEYTKSFTIKLGEVVKMDRNKCDNSQDNTCSKGLHVAGRSWLSDGYFGNTSLMVLVNPTDVVSVPHQDNYGKMRVCAYYPVQIIERDVDGYIIDQGIENGFEDDFINQIAYNGIINNEDDANYFIDIPQIPEMNTTNIVGRLHEIALSLKNKYVN